MWATGMTKYSRSVVIRLRNGISVTNAFNNKSSYTCNVMISENGHEYGRNSRPSYLNRYGRKIRFYRLSYGDSTYTNEYVCPLPTSVWRRNLSMRGNVKDRAMVKKYELGGYLNLTWLVLICGAVRGPDTVGTFAVDAWVRHRNPVNPATDDFRLGVIRAIVQKKY